MILWGAPRLPHPAENALAVPTTSALNMLEHQNWQHTKVASAKPMKQRATMKPAESVTKDMQKTTQGHTQRQCKFHTLAVKMDLLWRVDRNMEKWCTGSGQDTNTRESDVCKHFGGVTIIGHRAQLVLGLGGR